MEAFGKFRWSAGSWSWCGCDRCPRRRDRARSRDARGCRNTPCRDPSAPGTAHWRLAVVELGERHLGVGIDEGLLIDAAHTLHVADIESVLDAAIAGTFALELAVDLVRLSQDFYRVSAPRHRFGPRLSRALRRRRLRHRLARRGGSRSWQRRWYPGPQVLLGSDRAGHLFLACLKLLGEFGIGADHLCLRRHKLLGELRIIADHLCLRRLKLLGELGIVADHLCLADLELLDLLPHGCKIARHRLELLRRLGRQAGPGRRRDIFRCGLSQRCRLRRRGLRGCLNGRWARLRGKPRAFERQR